MLRKIMDDLQFPNGLAVPPDNNTLAVGDGTAGRMLYAAFAAGPSMGVPGGFTDPQRLTFTGVKAGTYFPGNGCPDGIHYDVKGNLWAASARLGGCCRSTRAASFSALCQSQTATWQRPTSPLAGPTTSTFTSTARSVSPSRNPQLPTPT